jgi:hypothetical protein
MAVPPSAEIQKKRRYIVYRLFKKPFGLFALSLSVTSVESVYASTGIDKFLLAGEERVTIGANIDTEVLLGGAGLIGGSAGTPYGRRTVCGMDSFLHLVSPLL